jgi:hypothetical protein
MAAQYPQALASFLVIVDVMPKMDMKVILIALLIALETTYK